MNLLTVKVALATDGRSWVDGVEVTQQAAGTLDGARAAALNHVARIARQQRRPVHVHAEDPDGRTWEFAVGADGDIVELDDVQRLPNDPDAHAVPPEVATRIATVHQALGSDRALLALRLAQDLADDLAEQHGPEHPHALRAVEFHAHVAYRAGETGTACELYLVAARGWRHLGSEAFDGALQRALALWPQVTGDTVRITWLGEQLVELLEHRGGRAQPTAAAVMQRIDALRLGAHPQ